MSQRTSLVFTNQNLLWKSYTCFYLISKPRHRGSARCTVGFETPTIVYGLESWRVFMLEDTDLLVTLDHQLLVKMFSDLSIENIKNPRHFYFKERRLIYKFSTKHLPGKINAAPDSTFWYHKRTRQNVHKYQLHIYNISSAHMQQRSFYNARNKCK